MKTQKYKSTKNSFDKVTLALVELFDQLSDCEPQSSLFGDVLIDIDSCNQVVDMISVVKEMQVDFHNRFIALRRGEMLELSTRLIGDEKKREAKGSQLEIEEVQEPKEPKEVDHLVASVLSDVKSGTLEPVITLSKLQRAYKIGANRASEIIKYFEKASGVAVSLGGGSVQILGGKAEG